MTTRDQTPDGEPMNVPLESHTKQGARRCQKRKRKSGEQCGGPAMKGQDVCRVHGGKAPQSMAAAARRLAEQEAAKEMEKAVERFGLKVNVSPSQALLDELQWTAGNVHYFRQKAAEVGEERLVMGVTKVLDQKGAGESGLGARKVSTIEAKPSVWYELWMREREHLVKVASAAARAGVEQRRIELAESQGMLIATVVRRILDSLLGALLAKGVDVREVWDEEVRVIVPREFRAIEAVTGGA